MDRLWQRNIYNIDEIWHHVAGLEMLETGQDITGDTAASIAVESPAYRRWKECRMTIQDRSKCGGASLSLQDKRCVLTMAETEVGLSKPFEDLE